MNPTSARYTLSGPTSRALVSILASRDPFSSKWDAKVRSSISPIIKFGYTRRPNERPVEHAVAFGGFEVLDCILSDDPEVLEKDFKSWLGFRMFRGTTSTGAKQHTELFRPTSQQDYEDVVRQVANLAIKIRESRQKTVEFEQMRAQANQAVLEAERARAETLRLQIQLEQLRVSADNTYEAGLCRQLYKA